MLHVLLGVIPDFTAGATYSRPLCGNCVAATALSDCQQWAGHADPALAFARGGQRKFAPSQADSVTGRLEALPSSYSPRSPSPLDRF